MQTKTIFGRFRLCGEDEISDPGSRAFVLHSVQGVIHAFVVRQGDQFHAFVNQCPHTGVELNWGGDNFLDLESQFIQCSMHGALFRLPDGVCVYGPCRGRALQRLDARVVEDGLHVGQLETLNTKNESR